MVGRVYIMIGQVYHDFMVMRMEGRIVRHDLPDFICRMSAKSDILNTMFV